MTKEENKRFHEYYEKYKLIVYKLGLRYSKFDEELAKDATQHAFLQLFVQIKEGTEFQNVETYLHTLVKNYIINIMKKAERNISEGDLEEGTKLEDLRLSESTEETWDQQRENHYKNQMLCNILKELEGRNPVWYHIVIEVFYKERSQVEVANEMEMSLTTMYAHIRRIRKWANKHKLEFQQTATDEEKKKVPKRHLFDTD